MTALPARTRAATLLGSAAAGLSRRLGGGNGTVIGGRVLLAVDRRALSTLAGSRPTALVSGTNGKTTTTRLLAAALGTAGPVVTNLRGANMPAGLAAALSAAGPMVPAVLEVDEAWLPKVAAEVGPTVVVLLNLSRDQLDRNNEVRMLSGAWRAAVACLPGALVVANADDPLTVWAAEPAARVIWVAAGQPWTADATGCPRCGARIDFASGALSEGTGEGSQGGWSCRSCQLARPRPDVGFTDDALVLADGRHLPLRLQLPGRCNRANAAMAAVAAGAFGVAAEAAVGAMAAMAEVDGRYRMVTVDGVRARLLLAKNPAGWLEVLDVIGDSDGPVVVGINARIADGRDPSWLWDVPFERLRGRLVVASGERSHDLAVRLLYAEVDHRRQPDLRQALRTAGTPSVDVVANYTAFMALTASLGENARG